VVPCELSLGLFPRRSAENVLERVFAKLSHRARSIKVAARVDIHVLGQQLVARCGGQHLDCGHKREVRDGAVSCREHNHVGPAGDLPCDAFEVVARAVHERVPAPCCQQCEVTSARRGAHVPAACVQKCASACVMLCESDASCVCVTLDTIGAQQQKERKRKKRKQEKENLQPWHSLTRQCCPRCSVTLQQCPSTQTFPKIANTQKCRGTHERTHACGTNSSPSATSEVFAVLEHVIKPHVRRFFHRSPGRLEGDVVQASVQVATRRVAFRAEQIK
jgi:hypothetical protein